MRWARVPPMETGRVCAANGRGLLLGVIYAGHIYWKGPGWLYDSFFAAPDLDFLLRMLVGFPWPLHRLDIFAMISLQSIIGILSTVLRWLAEIFSFCAPGAIDHQSATV